MQKENGLQEFLRSKAASSQMAIEEEVDWDARKKQWLSAISELYKLVKSWLQSLEKDGTIQFLSSPLELTEENLGTYKVEVLALLIGKQRVAFYPKGTLVLGANGRVDVRGQRAIRTLVWNDNKWFVVERSPKITILPFNEDSFQDLLQEVME